MASDDVSVVKRIREGDSVAFRELVIKYQDIAVGIAFSWVRDAEIAKDIAQESFLEAYANIGQLRDMVAFSGWFRQIVFKHCDRVTRRKRLLLSELSKEGHEDTSAKSPESELQDIEQLEVLRALVEALPGDQRLVVSLHYFAEASANEIASFLDLPLSTIKKRLHDARKRLRGEGERIMEKYKGLVRPSSTRQFAAETTFFIAIRSGDVDEIRFLLDEDPDLVDIQQNWASALVFEGILPFATRATALITAIETNNLATQQVLLDAGADVNGSCGCDTGESPIWAAALLNRLNMRRIYLDVEPSRMCIQPVVIPLYILLPFKAGVGMLVLLAELCRHFSSIENGKVIWTGFAQLPFDIGELEAEFSEFGIREDVEQSIASYSEDSGRRMSAYQRGLQLIELFLDQDSEILVIVQSAKGYENSVDESLLQISELSAKGSLTTIIMTPFPESREIWTELRSPYSAQITLDRNRVKQGLIPAIHPELSFSRNEDKAVLGSRHHKLLQRTRKELARYESIDPDFQNLDSGPDYGQPCRQELCRALLRYFCQPSLITEPFTGLPGLQVDRDSLLAEIENIFLQHDG
jgi:RNA polymerase sigma factor (sigma-70 family)